MKEEDEILLDMGWTPLLHDVEAAVNPGENTHMHTGMTQEPSTPLKVLLKSFAL